MKTHTKALIPVLMLVALTAVAEGQTGLSVPGDLAVTDDATIGDKLAVTGTTNMTGTATSNHFSNPYILQRYVFEYDESMRTNKAWPDTFNGLAMTTLFYAPSAGIIQDVFFSVEGAGSGWDSLLVDIRAGASADSSVMDVLPQVTPAVGDKSTTVTEGRQAQMSATMRNVDAGELVRIWGRVYGTKTDAPTGLKVWVVFQPDYGN